MLLDLTFVHRGVAVRRAAAEALVLDFAGGDDLAADLGARRSRPVAGQFIIRNVRDFDVQVDAVEQRAGDFAEIALNLNLRTTEAFFGSP